MRRAAAIAVLAALWFAAPAAALVPLPFTDVTPPGAGLIVCPAAVGGGAGLAWLRFTETDRGRDVFDLSAAGVDPPTPRVKLHAPGGCPGTATAPSGATLVTLHGTGFADERGRVFAVDRTASGATSPAIPLSDNDRGAKASGALASSGAALVTWIETPEGSTAEDGSTVHVAGRDSAGAFRRLGVIAGPADVRVGNLEAGLDDAGYGIVAWTQAVVAAGEYVTTIMTATRPPGGAFSPPHKLMAVKGSTGLRLVVGPTGEVLLAFAGSGSVRLATGTTRTGIGAARTIAAAERTHPEAVLTASGAAAVGWRQDDDIVISDRAPGGEFGAPHTLVSEGSRVGGVEIANLRFAATPDGRVLATWLTGVPAPDGWSSLIGVAALRQTDGTWSPAVALTATCRVPMDAFPTFDAAGRPRALLVDSGYISAGDYGFPSDTRVRIVRLGHVPATPTPPPKVTLTAARRQVLAGGRVRMRVRCARACDALVFAVIGGDVGPGSGLFPRFTRLGAGRTLRVSLRRESYFDDNRRLDREGATVKVRLVAHACDSAGRLARSRRTIRVRVPRVGR